MPRSVSGAIFITFLSPTRVVSATLVFLFDLNLSPQVFTHPNGKATPLSLLPSSEKKRRCERLEYLNKTFPTDKFLKFQPIFPI